MVPRKNACHELLLDIVRNKNGASANQARNENERVKGVPGIGINMPGADNPSIAPEANAIQKLEGQLNLSFDFFAVVSSF